MRKRVTLEVGDQRRWPASVLITKVQREQRSQMDGNPPSGPTILGNPKSCDIERGFIDDFDDRTLGPFSYIDLVNTWGETSLRAIPWGLTPAGGSTGQGGDWVWGVTGGYGYFISRGGDNGIAVEQASTLGTLDGLFNAPWEKTFNFSCKVWIEQPTGVIQNTVVVAFGEESYWPNTGPVFVISGGKDGDWTWGIQNSGFVDSVYQGFSYGGSTWLRIRWLVDAETNMMYGKLWYDGDTEPTDWMITNPLTGGDTGIPTMPSYFNFDVLRYTFGSPDNGPLEIRWDDASFNCDDATLGKSATVGQLYGPVFVATGNGSTSSWNVPFPFAYVPGTLDVRVNGISQDVNEDDPAGGVFSLDWTPLTGDEITAAWVVPNA